MQHAAVVVGQGDLPGRFAGVPVEQSELVGRDDPDVLSDDAKLKSGGGAGFDVAPEFFRIDRGGGTIGVIGVSSVGSGLILLDGVGDFSLQFAFIDEVTRPDLFFLFQIVPGQSGAVQKNKLIFGG